MKNLTSELADIHADLERGLALAKARIPEIEFSGYWLPLINNATLNENINLDQYVTRVGGIHHTAIIIDINGNELYETPPLYPEAGFELKSSFHYELQQAQQSAHADPNAIQKTFGEETRLRIKDPKGLLEHWNSLFAKYNLPIRTNDLIGVTGKAVDQSKEPEGGLSGDFSYD
jgi:hypothetical protein